MICLNPLLLNVFSAPTISPSQVFLKLTIYIFLERLKCLEAIVSPKTYWKWKLWLPLHYDISTFSSFLFWNCSPSVLYLIIYLFLFQLYMQSLLSSYFLPLCCRRSRWIVMPRAAWIQRRLWRWALFFMTATSNVAAYHLLQKFVVNLSFMKLFQPGFLCFCSH